MSSCISLASSSLKKKKKRTLDICQTLDGFCWQYEKCTNKFLGICIKKVIAIDKIEVEFKDKAMAKKLYDQNFVLTVRKAPL